MNGLKREKGTKANSKARIFCLFLAVVFILSQASGIKSVSASSKIYIDKIAGSNVNDGATPETAIKSYKKAKELLKGGGTIYVKVDGEWVIAEDTTKPNMSKKDKDEAEVTPAAVIDKATESVVTENTTPETVAKPEAIKEAEAVTEPEVTKGAEAVAEPEVTKEAVAEPEVTKEAEAVTEPEVTKEAEVTPVITQGAEGTPEVSKDEEAVSTDKVDDEVIDEATEATDVTVDEKDETATTDVEATPEATAKDDETVAIEKESAVEPAEILPAETQEKVAVLTDLVNQVTLMVEGQDDIGDVVGATQAYEELNEEVKDKIPDELYKRLRASQIVAAHSNRMSEGFSVAGDLPWYVEFKVVEKEGGGTFDFGETIGAYDLTLWNTLTDAPYELDGEVTVTIPVANATKYQNLSVIHYLPDGGHEILKVSRVDGEDAISFTTTSFSPYEIVGNTGDVYNQSGQGGTDSQGSGGASSGDGGSGNNNDGNDSVTSRSPGAKTSDANNILLLLGLAALAGTVVGGMANFKNKKNRL